MYGEKYYKDRLFGLYEYSPIKYLCGFGNMQYNNVDTSVQWELVVTITGESIVTIFSKEIINYSIVGNSNVRITGYSSCGIWDIKIIPHFINSISYDSLSNFQVMNC